MSGSFLRRILRCPALCGAFLRFRRQSSAGGRSGFLRGIAAKALQIRSLDLGDIYYNSRKGSFFWAPTKWNDRRAALLVADSEGMLPGVGLQSPAGAASAPSCMSAASAVLQVGGNSHSL